MCQVTLIGIMVILLYTSRACYNLVVLALTDIENINSFDYDWYNVSDQVSITSLSSDAAQIFLHTRRIFYLLTLTRIYSFLFETKTLTNTTGACVLSPILQADLRSNLGDAGYVVFGVILFVWELLPTSLVVFFFRVRKPAQDRVRCKGWLCQKKQSCRKVFPPHLFGVLLIKGRL